MSVPITGMYSFVSVIVLGLGGWWKKRLNSEFFSHFFRQKHFHSFAPSMIIESEIYRWEKGIILAKRRNNKIFLPPTTSRSREGIGKGRFSFICWWRLLALLLKKFIVLLRPAQRVWPTLKAALEKVRAKKRCKQQKCEPHLLPVANTLKFYE